MRFDARTVLATLGIGVLVVASAVFAIRAGHSTAGPAGRFEGSEDVDAPEPDDFLIEVLRATGDSTRIEVTLRVQGREDLGPVDLMPVFLVGPGSRTLADSVSTPNPAEPRETTFVFTGIEGRGPWRISGESLRVKLGAREVTVERAFDLDVPPIAAGR